MRSHSMRELMNTGRDGENKYPKLFWILNSNPFIKVSPFKDSLSVPFANGSPNNIGKYLDPEGGSVYL